MSLFKKLGLVQDDSIKEEKVDLSEKRTFPDTHQEFKFSDSNTIVVPKQIFGSDLEIGKSESNNPYLDQLRKAYNDGFTKLNMPDIDFYEIFQALNKFGNLDSAEALKMALAMCSNTLTKEILDTQSNQYAKNLMDSYSATKYSGETKLSEIQRKFTDEKSMIQNTIDKLEQDLANWKKERDNISNKFDPQISEIKLKSEANNIAYSEIMDKITKVQNNINKNL